MPIFVVLNRYLHTYEDKRFKRKKNKPPKIFLQFESWKTRLARGLRLEQISIYAPLTVVSRQIHTRKKG